MTDERPAGFYARIATRQPRAADHRLYEASPTALPQRVESLKLANRVILTGLLTNYAGKCDACKEHRKECYFSDLAASWKCAGCIQRAMPCKHNDIRMAPMPRFRAREKTT
ncbi:MAG: hypothetical protein M1829_001871 [Trizodia sp. TS-e1964]|nr:MAG: hypothetical protein M1829_001871 [Trizodia sp. TS-e1964]